MLFQDLKAFVTVIECASLTKAAHTLCLTQSAVSRRIQHLEETLGATLLDRTTRPPSPTAMGYRVYEKAVQLLRDANYLINIPQENATPSGRYRLGLTQIIADAVMFDTVTRLRAQFSDLQIQLVTQWSSELEQLVSRGELDAASLMIPAPSNPAPHLDNRLITTFKVLVVQSTHTPLAGSMSDIKSLSSHDWILNPEGCGYREALQAAMGSQGQTLKVSVDTQGAVNQMRMVAAGMGLGLIPQQLLNASPLAQELSVITVDDFELSMDVWMVYSPQPGNLRAANELLTQSIAESLR